MTSDYILTKLKNIGPIRGGLWDITGCLIWPSFLILDWYTQKWIVGEEICWSGLRPKSKYRSQVRSQIAAIEANNDIYCLQKRIEKFPLGG